MPTDITFNNPEEQKDFYQYCMKAGFSIEQIARAVDVPEAIIKDVLANE